MKRTVTLATYLSVGGQLSNISPTEMKTTYHDGNNKKRVVGIKSWGRNTNGTELFIVDFDDNTSHRYAGIWIEMSVEFVLHHKYLANPNASAAK